MGKKAFAYLRVSGKGQLKGDGFDRQETEIRGYAIKNGFEIVTVFKEKAVSGIKGEADRPAFQKMVAEILKNGVRTVIIEGLDRLAREYRIQETLLIYLASKNIDLISARTKENVTEAVMSDPMRKALVQVQGIFSELEKNQLVIKLRSARDRIRVSTGKCEGRKGYAERKPEIITAIKKLRKKRKGQPRPSFAEVARQLNKQGLTSITGKPFNSSRVAGIVHANGLK